MSFYIDNSVVSVSVLKMRRDRSEIKTYQNHVLVPGHGDGTRWIGQNRHRGVMETSGDGNNLWSRSSC